MNISQWHSWFDFLIDKMGSPYMTSTEKDLLFNRAIMSYISKFFDKNERAFIMEKTERDLEELSPLIVRIRVGSDSNGIVTLADINAAVDAAMLPNVNNFTRQAMHVLQVSQNGECLKDVKTVRSRFIRHNDYQRHKTNSFKEPTDKYPQHTYFNGYIQLYPEKEKMAELVVLAYPLSVTLNDPFDTGVAGTLAQSCELEDKTHNDILFLACKMAGMSIREAQYFQMVQALDGEINPPR